MRRENHLKSPSHFALVYRTGRRARTGSVVAISARAADGPPKVGFATSRRLGGAVARNRARRRLRAAVSSLVPVLAPGALVVLQATQATGTIEFSRLEADVRRALAEAGALDA